MAKSEVKPKTTGFMEPSVSMLSLSAINQLPNMSLRNPTSAILLAAVLTSSLAHAAAEPRNLLDEKLSGWEVFTGVPHKSVEVPGFFQSTSTDGTTGTPVGLADPLGIFKIIMEDGKPVLHVSGQVYAGLSTLEEFENYHFSCQFKWGEKKWEPRLTHL